jgi:hypothetical protein
MYKCFVKKQTNHKIKTLKFYHGGEYKFDAFNNFYQNQGIKKEFTTSNTPQQNGVLERKNKNLINVALAMLSNLKVPKVFWRDAILIKNYKKIKISRKVVTNN